MRKAFVALLLLAVGVGLAPAARAQENVSGLEPGVVRAISGQSKTGTGVFGTANSNCVAVTCDTVWVGHSNSGPGGAFLGVSVGGLWDFDAGSAGTDSTQGWRRWAIPFTSNAAAPAASRPAWALDYGNMVNEGNQNLWNARDIAGRKYIKTGIAGVWHSSTLAGVKKNLSDGAEPSAAPIAGTRSAWCGLRESRNQSDVDALTGNYINGDLFQAIGTVAAAAPDFPGFCSLWDQLLYKDFASTGTGSISFRVRTDMSDFIDTTTNGSGWFNPDPTNIANFVNNPADSFMVYVGSPKDTGVFDTNRRWISEVIDYTKPVKELFAVTGVFPFASADTALTVPYAGATPVGGNIRVVFRVKTNRVRADGVVAVPTGYNSKQGAAVIDAVQVDASPVYGFEAAGDITARSLAGNIALTTTPWVTTGRPPSTYYHLAGLSTILYEDLCGAVGATTRRCSMQGNVIVAGDADNSNIIAIEGRQIMESPTVNLAVRLAAPGTKNDQGIDQETAARTSVVEDYDIYSGFMSFDESVFWQFGGRFFGGISKQPLSGNACWSPWQSYPFIVFQPDPFCIRDLNNLSSAGMPAGVVDSVRIYVSTITQGFRFGGTNLGNTRGTYWDNARIGLVRGGDAPAISQEIWNKYQDQFPINEGVTPGDNASFDTTTIAVRSGLNIVAPATAPGVVAGDSILANSPFVGDGFATGVRVDLIFRIDPGPGNYSTKGNRSSALVEKDAVHPFWASYKANNGPFGTPGGHGTFWNKNVWNSCRMDSADVNLYPVVSRGIGGPLSPVWAGTIHESEYLAGGLRSNLGITHNLCFLVDPNGTTDQANLICDGSVPAPYGAVSGQTKENTKILPDGYFSPGTHVEYFMRRTLLENPASISLLFDTTNVAVQDAGTNPDFDQERWSNFDALPDMWKSTRYGGAGLACMLMIDGNDRRGADPQYRGAADSLGYGKNNGATAGWKRVPGLGTEDPAGFVAANLGQYGLNFDHYDIRASESGEAGHPGVRFALNTGGIALKGDKSGPSAAQLASLYTSVLHLAGDLNSSTIHDGVDPQEGADDIALYDGFLAGASPANRRGMWLSGDGIMEDGALNSDDGTFLYPFLTDDFGSDLTATNYKNFSSLAVPQTVGFLPTAPWAHPGRVYGFNNICLVLADVLAVIPTVDGAAEGSQYQNVGPGPFTASVYRPTGATRDFRTLIDGFDLSNLRGNYANLGQVATMPESDTGRIYWFDDVVTGHFQICARRGPVTGVGDLPGVEGGRFSNVNLGSFPNPAFAGRNVTLRFTLAKAQDVTIRVYNVAGREVANFTKKGVEGPNSIVWNGAMSNGAKATAGVYFYAIDGIDFVKGSSKAQKMILLGANAE